MENKGLFNDKKEEKSKKKRKASHSDWYLRTQLPLRYVSSHDPFYDECRVKHKDLAEKVFASVKHLTKESQEATSSRYGMFSKSSSVCSCERPDPVRYQDGKEKNRRTGRHFLEHEITLDSQVEEVFLRRLSEKGTNASNAAKTDRTDEEGTGTTEEGTRTQEATTQEKFQKEEDVTDW